MQCSPKDEWDENGCFVYKMINNLEVRDYTNVGDESRNGKYINFEEGDLVSIDLIRYSRHVDSTNGPFLRLSDCSGWLFERKYGEIKMEKVGVDIGLWKFRVLHYVALRSHPNDKTSHFVEPEITYYPMQKVYCDRRVATDNGVYFYRVQNTNGWIFDRRGDHFKLIDFDNVRMGLFAFRVLPVDGVSSIAIRTKPSTSEKSKTTWKVKANDVVAVDAICLLNSSGIQKDGPYLRLVDGSGWLFESKNGMQLLKEIPIISGLWTLRVLNSPAGIAKRYHPIDKTKQFMSSKIYQPDEICQCDRMIISPSGVKFYHVKGTIGWVFDKRDGYDMMQLISSST